ncbi:MAG: CaiB/BaiF CoA transferase family protein [Gammaproteobacteria bacterium]
MSVPQEHILTGLKVLDFTRAVAGPTCTRMLAEMGADVIKIEAAPDGDLVRSVSKFTDERSLYYIQQNLNKKSVCLDLRDPRALEMIRELVPHVDVVVQNFKPGVMASMGLDYDSLKALREDIILCSISALGQTGPLALKPGYDYIAQAYAGITSMIGDPDAPPYIPHAALGDVSTGVHAALAVTSALLYHARTGKGQHLDIGLLDVYYHCHEVNVHQYSGSGGEMKPKRTGRHMGYIAPAGIFAATSGSILIMAFLHHWKDLCTAMGRPELIDDEIYGNDTSRLEHVDETVAIIEAWLATLPDVDSAIEILEAHNVPCAPILSVEETVTHPHLVQRGTVRTITDRIAGEFQIPGNPLRFSEFPDPPDYEAATLGQHNREVLRDVLGKDAATIDSLYADGVLIEKPV